MTVFVSDTFTGTNGTGWSGTNWVTGQSTTGASATIQGNAGRLNSGSNSGYSGKRSQKVNFTNQTNGEILVDFRYPTGIEVFFDVDLRGDTVADGQNAYQLQLARDGTIQLWAVVNYDGGAGPIATQTITINDNTWYSCKLNVSSSSIKAKVWAQGGTEPGWVMSVTDTSLTGSGTAFLSCAGGNASGGYVDVDNFFFSDGSTVTDKTASETGTASDGVSASLVSKSAADAASGAEVLTVFSKGAGETGVANDLGQIAGLPVFATETVTGTENTSLVVTIPGFESITAVESAVVSVPPTEITDFDFVHGLDLARRVGKGPYRLLLPWTEGQRADDRFFRRVSVHRGLTLLRIGGFFQLLEDPTIEQLLAADRIYLGGYDNWVTDDEAQDLGNAGWADYIQGFDYIPDAFYGSGIYGESVYGN